ncbi:MAG: hypothetical protein ACFCGT_12095 [Sandaracinaceae bacterium]
MCIYDEDREKYVERRVRTDLEGFQRALEKYAGARVLLEASTESEWVARLLEELGFEVIVAEEATGRPATACRGRPRDKGFRRSNYGGPPGRLPRDAERRGQRSHRGRTCPPRGR